MKRSLFSLPAAVTSLLILLSSCSSAGVSSTVSTASTSSADLRDVTLRVAEVGWGNWEAAFKEAGLDKTPYKVQYSVFAGGNLCLEAMAAGQIDFTGSSETPPLFAAQAANGGNFKIIAVNNSNTLLQELVIPKGSPVKTVADLKGKKVGYIKATTAQYFLLKMLQKAGLQWSDIQAEPISTADGVTALVSGRLDAFASYGNTITSARRLGATTLASAKDILSGNFPYEASLAAISDKGKHAAILDYLLRIEKTNLYQAQHVADWANISAKPQGMTTEQNIEVLKNGNAQRKTHLLPVGDTAIASEQDVANAFASVGLLKSKVDVKDYYSDAFTAELKSQLPKVQ